MWYDGMRKDCPGMRRMYEVMKNALYDSVSSSRAIDAQKG